MKAKFKKEITDDNLCAYCEKLWPECNAISVIFNNGAADNTNVIECDGFEPFFMDVSNIIEIKK